MQTMKQTTSTTWKKMMEIPTKAKTVNGIVKAIKRHTDFFNDMTQEEMENYVKSEWVEICSNGVIIWED